MQNHVINLSRRPDRLKNFAERNKGFAEDIHIRVAVDGREIDRQRLIADGVLAPDSPYSDRSVAIALSHMGLWQHCIDINEPITIFEDDVVIHPSATQIRAEMMAQKPEFDLLALGFNLDWPLQISFGHNLPTTTLVFDYARDPRNDHTSCMAVRVLMFAGACAYTISPKGARRLLDMLTPIAGGECPVRTFEGMFAKEINFVSWDNTGIDVGISMSCPKLEAFICLPPVVLPDNDWSDTLADMLGSTHTGNV